MFESEITKLVSQAQSGDSTALAQLLDVFQPLRDKLISKFYSTSIAKDDMRQQITLFIIMAILGYDSSRDPSPLRHIVSKTRNDTINYVRKERNIYRNNITVDNIAKYDSSIDYTNTTLNSVLISSALKKIPPREQQILRMRYWEYLTESEIAKRLGISQSAVHKIISRALYRLRAILLVDGDGEHDA